MEETDICFVAYYGGLFHCKCGGDCYRIPLPCTVFQGKLAWDLGLFIVCFGHCSVYFSFSASHHD
jgi:hypothetical protein